MKTTSHQEITVMLLTATEAPNNQLVGDFRDRQNLFCFCSVAESRQMAGQQKSNMAAQQGTNDNTADTLHKNLQQKVHQKRFTS